MNYSILFEKRRPYGACKTVKGTNYFLLAMLHPPGRISKFKS